MPTLFAAQPDLGAVAADSTSLYMLADTGVSKLPLGR
jgi:hypothetical protein